MHAGVMDVCLSSSLTTTQTAACRASAGHHEQHIALRHPRGTYSSYARLIHEPTVLGSQSGPIASHHIVLMFACIHTRQDFRGAIVKAFPHKTDNDVANLIKQLPDAPVRHIISFLSAALFFRVPHLDTEGARGTVVWRQRAGATGQCAVAAEA